MGCSLPLCCLGDTPLTDVRSALASRLTELGKRLPDDGSDIEGTNIRFADPEYNEHSATSRMLFRDSSRRTVFRITLVVRLNAAPLESAQSRSS